MLCISLRHLFALAVFIGFSSALHATSVIDWIRPRSVTSYQATLDPKEVLKFREYIRTPRLYETADRDMKVLPALHQISPKTTAFDIIFSPNFWRYQQNIYRVTVAQRTDMLFMLIEDDITKEQSLSEARILKEAETLHLRADVKRVVQNYQAKIGDAINSDVEEIDNIASTDTISLIDPSRRQPVSGPSYLNYCPRTF